MSKSKMIWITALILGLGWSVRGHFGHEWGASWAGAMATLAVLATARNESWAQRAPALVALGAIGWAVAGMASYGIIVGYCRGIHFGNVLYGYSMLAVVGGLYGFIGGGLFGLGLETSDEKSPDWPKLITEMMVGGLLFWGLFIYQLEWFMTPPRSEMWAGAMGASLALSWYLWRHGFRKALRVAGYTALGAGFGFAFGNFIQTFGATTGSGYNWWNVMEFTLGFCGGLGLAWSVATCEWPEKATPSKTANWYGLLLVIFVIPLINYVDSMTLEYFNKMAAGWGISDSGGFAARQLWSSFFILLFFTVGGTFLWRRAQWDRNKLINLYLPIMLFGHSAYYMLFGFIKKGMFYKGFHLRYSDSLYFPVLVIVAVLWYIGHRHDKPITAPPIRESWQCQVFLFAGLVVILMLLTFVSINMHDGIAGYHERFK